MPASAAGSAVMMMNGIEQRLEIHDDQHVHQMMAPIRPISRPLNEAFMVCDLAAHHDVEPLGKSFWPASMILLICAAT
jgi:hypothetical protein